MLFTLFHTGTISFDRAVLASQILLLCVFFLVSLLLAVEHATKVGLLAVEALIESALLHCNID